MQKNCIQKIDSVIPLCHSGGFFERYDCGKRDISDEKAVF
jgi:hypothetical protein